VQLIAYHGTPVAHHSHVVGQHELMFGRLLALLLIVALQCLTGAREGIREFGRIVAIF